MKAAAPALALFLILAGHGPAAAADAASLYAARCGTCHALDPAAPEKPGPNLAGLVGRPVAADPRFDYSPALRAARGKAPAWNETRLAEFLADPEEMFPGLWMGANGMRDPGERAEIVKFLAGRR
ncbi:MAG: c-type cytochrome [Rhodospirillales bacterium]|nr:c-type cytochrome [Rhodospirillales bacterium]